MVQVFYVSLPPYSLPPLPLPLPNHPRARGVPAPHAALALQHARTSTLLNSDPLHQKMAFSRFPVLAAAVVLVATAGLASAEVREEWTGGRGVGARRAAAPQWRRVAARACGGAARAPPPASPAAPKPSAFGARTGAPPLKERAETGA
jgi:hypothetical protein